jgi:hypothetical protein
MTSPVPLQTTSQPIVHREPLVTGTRVEEADTKDRPIKKDAPTKPDGGRP